MGHSARARWYFVSATFHAFTGSCAARMGVGSAPNHDHDVDIAQFSTSPTGQTSVDVTMPYVQLRACVKN